MKICILQKSALFEEPTQDSFLRYSEVCKETEIEIALRVKHKNTKQLRTSGTERFTVHSPSIIALDGKTIIT